METKMQHEVAQSDVSDCTTPFSLKECKQYVIAEELVVLIMKSGFSEPTMKYLVVELDGTGYSDTDLLDAQTIKEKYGIQL